MRLAPGPRPAPIPSQEDALHVVAAAIVHEGRCLVGKRLPGGSAGGCWEFPGGKVETGEAPEDALHREILEELGVHILIGDYMGRGTARGGERLIVLDVYSASLASERLPENTPEHEEIRFISAAEIDEVNWASADLPLLDDLRRLLEVGA